MITKSFQFSPESEEDAAHRHDVAIKINDQTFKLAGDITSTEILEMMSTASRADGALRTLRRVIDPKDWAEFARLTAPAQPTELGDMVQEVVNAYAGFPTTKESDSSPGSGSTGDTQEPGSEQQE